MELSKAEVWRMNSDAQLRRRMEAMPHRLYDANRIDKRYKTDVADEYGQPMGQERYAVGQLWVFASTLNDAFGTRVYWVYNTQTKVLVSFTPERGIARDKRTYMSEKDRFRTIAAGTGVAGGYMEKGFLAISAGMLTGGLAYEVEGAAVVGTAIRGYVVKASEGASIRAMVDFSTQLGVGAVTGKGSWGNRFKTSFTDVNWTSVAGAAAVNSEGLKWWAKALVALGSSATTNYYTTKFSNVDAYKSFGHAVDFTKEKESKEFVINIIAGTVFDQLKEYGAPWIEKSMRNTPNTMGMLTAIRHNLVPVKTAIKAVDQKMVAVLSYEIGGLLESTKKLWENYNVDKAEAAKKKTAPSTRPILPAKR
ncbi:hypothetical protein [Hymenobacter chitinivorans]|uniref:hypothetical protein n=1 Tax=Hymenobacter chitinivorans TaxID=89969 RepID=UPI0012FD9FD3|nr:hypothetical protein [Hymenobacter chitinivorans]